MEGLFSTGRRLSLCTQAGQQSPACALDRTISEGPSNLPPRLLLLMWVRIKCYFPKLKMDLSPRPANCWKASGGNRRGKCWRRP